MQASFFAQDQWTMNRLTLQGAMRYDQPWSWFPENSRAAKPVLPGRDLREDRRRDRLQRRHAAHGRRVRRVRQRQDGAEGEPRQVSAGRQRQQPGVRREPDAADPDGYAGFRRPDCVSSVARLLESVRRRGTGPTPNFDHDAGLRPDQPASPTASAARSTTCSSAATSWWAPASIRRSVQRLGRASVRLVVRRVGAAGDLPAGVGGGRLLPPLVHAVFTRGGTVTDNLADRAERCRGLHAQRCRTTRACRTAGSTRSPAVQREPERVRSGQQR